jgi:hypothetical protein
MRKLEKLKELPGFTGNPPRGPSRWSTERSACGNNQVMLATGHFF